MKVWKVWNTNSVGCMYINSDSADEAIRIARFYDKDCCAVQLMSESEIKMLNSVQVINAGA